MITSPEQRRLHPEVAKLKAKVFTRPLPEEYADLIKKSPFCELSSDFSMPTLQAHFRRVEDIVRGSDVFDLGCGQQSAFETMAAMGGAQRYIGVDQRPLNPFKPGEMPAYGLQGDILDLVSRIEVDPDNKKTFILSGLEASPVLGSQEKDYLKALQTELSRICQPGDQIIVGGGVDGFNLEEYGFEITYQNKKLALELEIYVKK